MEIYQLKVFLEVAQHLSFTGAAEALNLTQPAVSAKIKSLEASLGTELFHRLGRKIELTVVGNYLLERGPHLLALEERLIKEIEQIKQGEFNRLTIGCTATIASGWLPKILFSYRQQYPDINLQCHPFDDANQLYQAIVSGEVDVGFSETDSGGFGEIDAVAVDRFQYCLMVATDHRLANANWLSLKHLNSEIWVFPAEATPERLILDARLHEIGMTISDFPNHEIVRSPSLMSTFLSQGHYLGFASSLQFQTERRAKLLTAIPLQEFPLDLKLFMLRRKQSAKNNPHQKRVSAKPVQQLIQLIDERIQYDLTAPQPVSPKPSAAASHSIPVYFQSSGLPQSRPNIVKTGTAKTSPQRTDLSTTIIPKTDAPKTLTISVGTQNKTIQTVTAGIIIQQLGLLEHFLPRTGRYHNTQYNIQWRDFTSGAPIVSGLQNDRLDIGILGDYPLLLSGLQPTETDSPVAKTKSKSKSKTRPAQTRLAKTRLVSFVASNPDGTGNTVIVPHQSPLTSLNDLRHRVIAVPFESAAHGMIMRTLARAKLLPDVTLTSIDNLSIHRLTPQRNQADGYAYFAPLHDIASHKGKFRRLLESDTDKLPTFHGVVVRENFAETHPDVVIAYLKALIAAQYWYENTPSARSLVSNWAGLNAEIVDKTLAHQHSDAKGLFFSETQIRTDWVTNHLQALSTISGNESLKNLNLDTWIQPEFLKTAMATL